jgi:hypothetical protein
MKVGDKVEVINSSYWGYEIGWKGEVKVSKPSYGKFAIDVTFDNGKIITGCDSGNFKIVKEVNMGFAVGQKVKIIDSGSAPLDTKGLFGTIIGTGSGPKYWYVKVEGRGAGKDPNWYYHEDNIKIVKEEEKMMVFKKGDKVIARKDVTGFRFGCASGMEKARETQVTGIVQSERGHDGRYSVSFPTYSGTYQWHESELAYAEFDMVTLKTGQIVQLRNGDRYVVLTNTFTENVLIGESSGDYIAWSSFENNGTYKRCSDQDIMKVFEVENTCAAFRKFANQELMDFDDDDYKIVYDRNKDGKVAELETLVNKLQGQLTDAQAELKKIKG